MWLPLPLPLTLPLPLPLPLTLPRHARTPLALGTRRKASRPAAEAKGQVRLNTDTSVPYLLPVPPCYAAARLLAAAATVAARRPQLTRRAASSKKHTGVVSMWCTAKGVRPRMVAPWNGPLDTVGSRRTRRIVKFDTTSGGANRHRGRA